MEITQHEFYIQGNNYQLFVKRFSSLKENSLPILLLHGSIENGKIFYSNSLKGLAPFLAKHGYDVFVPDLRGHGKSTPPINKQSSFGLYDLIEIDLNLIVHKIKELKPNMPQIWMAHSWGGICLLSYFAKFNPHTHVSKMVFFGVKRRITIQTLQKIFMIDVMWRFIGKVLVNMYGYLPAQKINMGSDNESKKTYLETDEWVKRKSEWKDLVGFDIRKTLQNIELPPILSFTGINDTVLGHPTDAKLLLDEIHSKKYTFKVLGKKFNHLEDYDHISILTSPKAEKDHFLEVLDFIQ